MRSLQGFSDAATPVFEDLNQAAPSLTDATRTLTPFSKALTVSLKSLGAAGEASGPIFREADPIVRKTSELAKSGVSPTGELARLSVSLKQTKGWDYLVKLIYNTTASLNGFDKYGHFGRTLVSLTNCLEYFTNPEGLSGCDSNFNGENKGELSLTARQLIALIRERGEQPTGGTSSVEGLPATGLGKAAEVEHAEEGTAAEPDLQGTEPLLNYLLGQ